MPTNPDAHAFAATAHFDQVDKAGQPYIQHLNRVAGRAADRARYAADHDELAVSPDDVIQAAYLHDVLEDTATTAEDLERAGFGAAVVEMVQLLSKLDDGSTYAQRVVKLSASRNLGAILVKLSDNEDNRRMDRDLSQECQLTAQYATVRPMLDAAASALGYTGP